MASGVRQVPPQVVIRVAECSNTVVREADQEKRLRDPGQLGSRARGEAPQLEELDGGGHPQLFAHLSGGDAKGEQRILGDVEQDLAHWTHLGRGGAVGGSSSPKGEVYRRPSRGGSFARCSSTVSLFAATPSVRAAPRHPWRNAALSTASGNDDMQTESALAVSLDGTGARSGSTRSRSPDRPPTLGRGVAGTSGALRQRSSLFRPLGRE